VLWVKLLRRWGGGGGGWFTEGDADGDVPVVPAGFMREVKTRKQDGSSRVWYHFCEEEGGGWGFTSIRKLKGSSQNSIESLLKEKPHLAQAGISLKSFCFLSGGVATPVRALKPPLDTIIDSSNTTSDPGKHQTSEGICVSAKVIDC
jgi:hypothetical protein